MEEKDQMFISIACSQNIMKYVLALIFPFYSVFDEIEDKFHPTDSTWWQMHSTYDNKGSGGGGQVEFSF